MGALGLCEDRFNVRGGLVQAFTINPNHHQRMRLELCKTRFLYVSSWRLGPVMAHSFSGCALALNNLGRLQVSFFWTQGSSSKVVSTVSLWGRHDGCRPSFGCASRVKAMHVSACWKRKARNGCLTTKTRSPSHAYHNNFLPNLNLPPPHMIRVQVKRCANQCDCHTKSNTI